MNCIHSGTAAHSSDDKKILKWSGDGEARGLVTAFEPSKTESVYITDMHWFPAAPGKGQAASDVYVTGGSDGTACLNQESFTFAPKQGELKKLWMPTKVRSCHCDGTTKEQLLQQVMIY